MKFSLTSGKFFEIPVTEIRTFISGARTVVAASNCLVVVHQRNRKVMDKQKSFTHLIELNYC